YERSHLHSPSDDDKILLVNDALESLAMEDPLQARVVELRFFAGLSNAEASRTPDVSALRFGKPTRRDGACKAQSVWLGLGWMINWMHEKRVHDNDRVRARGDNAPVADLAGSPAAPGG